MMGPMMGSGYGYSGYSIFGMFLGLVFFVLIIAGVALLIYWIIKQSSQEKGGQISSRNKSIEILKERYAKGEINKEEYEKIKKDLLA